MPYNNPYISQWEAIQMQNPVGGRGSYRPPTVNYGGASGVAPAAGMNLTGLTDYINNLQRTAQTAANQARIPGAAGLEETSSGNIGSELRGEVDPSTLRLLQQQAAERGVTTGIDPSSPNANANYLQALGLTSFQRQQQGQRDLSAAYARNPAAPLFDPSTQLLTPYQTGQLDIERGRLDLEAQRIAAENARAAQSNALRYGGEPAGGPAPGGTRTGTTGATASDLLSSFAPDATEAWWNSIGFRPGTGGVSGTGSTTFDFGDAASGYEGMFDPANYSPGGPLEFPTTGGTGNAYTGYEEMFDPSLYP